MWATFMARWRGGWRKKDRRDGWKKKKQTERLEPEWN